MKPLPHPTQVGFALFAAATSVARIHTKAADESAPSEPTRSACADQPTQVGFVTFAAVTLVAEIF